MRALWILCLETHPYMSREQAQIAAARLLLSRLPIDAPVDVFLSRHFYERSLCGLVVAEPRQLATQIDPYHGGDVHHSSLEGRPDFSGRLPRTRP